jgi:TetR/AcrR family transcriptional regulator, transcriptional repressor for nem operon
MIRLVVRKGFSSTTVADICEEAGVTKGGFFHHFPTKEDAALAALQLFFNDRQRAQDSFVDAASVGSFTSVDRVMRHIDFAVSPAATKYQGCFLGVMALETSRSHPVLQACCQQLFAKWIDDFDNELKQAAPHLTNAQTAAAARAFIATIEGGLMMSKCAADPTQVRDALSHYKTQLQQMCNKEQHHAT